MKKVKPMLKKAGIALLVILVLMQFYRPARNQSNDNTNAISKKYALSDSVETILKASCYDCHSNYTVYPWYANIQPVSAWLTNHVNEGKQHLNFSEFSTYKINKQYHAIQGISKTLKKEEMPLPSYLIIHTYAKLSPEQNATLIAWADGIAANIKANNPADSLIYKRQRRED
jgi:hypothetical protein